jgi:hypothetical protein
LATGGPGGVGDDRGILGRALGHLLLEVARPVLGELPPALLQILEAQQAGILVVPEPSRVVVDDVLEPGALLPDVEQLVDLLLVLDDREAGLRVVDDVLHLLLDGVQSDRDPRTPAPASPSTARPVVADHRGLVRARSRARPRPRAIRRAYSAYWLRCDCQIPGAFTDGIIAESRRAFWSASLGKVSGTDRASGRADVGAILAVARDDSHLHH